MNASDSIEEILSCVHEQALRYVRAAPDMRVSPGAAELAALDLFEEPLSDTEGDPLVTLRLLDRAGSPATVANTGGRYFGLVTGGTLPVALGANWMATAWDQLGLNAVTSPVTARLEQIAGRWTLDLLDLPSDSGVGFVTGTSMAHFTCLAAARAELLARQGYDLLAKGMRNSPAIRIVTSEDIHVSVLKTLALLGIGMEEVERVAVDDQGRMTTNGMPRLDERTIVICQAGNVNSGSFDPFDQICDAAAAAGAWVHVDGAFGLWAAASPKLRHLTRGMQRADSWTTDTHKWLNTPYDCGMSICRHPAAVSRAMAFQAAYLAIGAQGVTLPITVPEMSRRARGIDVWATLRTLGRSGVARMIEATCQHTRQFAEGLADLGFELMNDVVLNQVVAIPPDNISPATLAARVQATGECWFGTTRWKGREAIRISISSWRTKQSDVERSIVAVKASLRHLSRG